MDEAEKRKIEQDIIKKRRLPYSLDLIEVNGDKYVVLNNYGSTITYIKKGDEYFLEEELK
ncbi:MAG: hypothetical protein ACTSU4_04585 [Promethearchaeota archaeon]